MDTKLAYLAGIIDGEGCLIISLGKKNKKGYYRISACVTIANTDPRLIIECVRILESIGISCSILTNRAKNIPVRKPVWVVKFGGHKAIIKLFNAIEKYLVSKKDQAELLRRFIEQRYRNGLTNPYTHKDREFVGQMSLLKHSTIPFPLSVESKRLAPSAGDVVLRAAKQLVESAEMSDRLN